MEDYYQQVVQGEDALKRLARKIPGFGGYIEKEARREADKLLRQTIADRMAEQWRRLTEIQRQLAQRGEILLLDDIEAAAIRLRTFVDQIRTASYGYAGFFDAVKVKEDALARLYAYDLALLDLVEEVKQAVDRLEAALGTEELPQALRDLMSLARRCVETFHRREEVIVGEPQGEEDSSKG